MPSCAAIGCTNSSKKGFLMKRFSRDPKRRLEWTTQVNRINWEPTDFSVLCEVHFEPELWEKTRQDGSRKLRYNAIPTNFSFRNSKPILKSPSSPFLPNTNSITISKVPQLPLSMGPCCSKTIDVELSPDSPTSISNVLQYSGDEISESSSEPCNEKKLALFNKLSDKQSLEMYRKLYKRKSASFNKLKNKFRQAKYEIKV
ncbi:hypothetical protein ABEB36_014662 [Hypothenemus hampei]|uniref:THAP-type domain-containing protein n=1 Tax=Hypothenemus hampei TaxID=57062 RepID=A0ABD1E4I9_HYPHA